MELEQRIKSLEYEMQILKTELHRALLEIQEQILVYYYPELTHPDEVPSPSPSTQEPVVTLKTDETASFDPTALNNWVRDTVTKIGQGRTGQLLSTYWRRASIAYDAQEALRQLTPPVNAENAVDAVAVNEILTVVTALDEILGKQPDVEVALSIIEEAGLG